LNNLPKAAAENPIRNYVRYRLRKPLTIVVLGMHRSGTSFITRAINLLGARVGNSLLGEGSANPKGHWEHSLALGINKTILKSAGGAWDDPPPQVESRLLIRFKMKRFLAKLHQGERTAVWKDPRTVLTFPVWQSEIVNYVPVFIFRSPASVASSLRKRDDFSIEKGLRLWREYNSRILEIDNREAASYFVNFDGGVDHISEVLKSLSKESDLHFNPAALDFYDRSLRTSDTSTSVSGGKEEKMYEELKRRANYR
jgi:hypothetical protein